MIKDHLIPPELTPEQIGYKYANDDCSAPTGAEKQAARLSGREGKGYRGCHKTFSDDMKQNTLCFTEEGHTQRYIRQKPGKVNKYRAMQQPTMTCRYRVDRLLFTLTISAYAIMVDNIILYTKSTREIMLEGYATVQEMAEKWGLNERTVQTMCATGKIEGLTKFGRSWAIPKDTEKPADNRVKSGVYKDWRKKYTKNSEG